jgi:2-dehydro-3-deoxyphosphogluconate aldolase/(4S)-4-hydroxy-2-oxoglutarate aldolase
MLAGAGTVVSVAQVDAAIDAGARFIVSPGFSRAVVTRCIEERIPVVPGCVTSTEMMWALEEGLEVVKFFPAEQAGGLPYLKAVSAPFPALHFMPTGGINAGNIGLYSGFTRVLACGATWMAAAELIREENYEEIARRSKEAVDAVIEARAGHARASLRVV